MSALEVEDGNRTPPKRIPTGPKGAASPPANALVDNFSWDSAHRLSDKSIPAERTGSLRLTLTDTEREKEDNVEDDLTFNMKIDTKRQSHRRAPQGSFGTPTAFDSNVLCFTPSIGRTPRSRKSFQSSLGGANLMHMKETLVKEDAIKSARDMFSLMDAEECGSITSGVLVETLSDAGLEQTDPRLVDFFETLNDMGGLRRDIDIGMEDFLGLIKGRQKLISQALKNELKVPDFPTFTAELDSIFESVRDVTDGDKASYIPVLAEQDENLWAYAVCTVDGQQHASGDSDYSFCIQSCSKPITYLMASQENGYDKVHYHVGREPSGARFNKLHLKAMPCEKYPQRQVPHNPLINAGAIMCSSLVARKEPMAKRFAKVCAVWNRLVAGRVGFSNTTYWSEKDTANRNWCLGYMMQEYKSFPEDSDLGATLDFYFQQCSIEADTVDMSVMAATLANGGANPKTGDRIFDPPHVKNCLSLMLSSGMYDFSGEWAFTIGLPAKSGVSGCVWVVVPEKMGFACFSPKLDEMGNSARSVAFYQNLVDTYNFHLLDNAVGNDNKYKKSDPTVLQNKAKDYQLMQLLMAAVHGDLNDLLRLRSEGTNLFSCDYDLRTALHLACCEGHTHIVKFLVIVCSRSYPKDKRSAVLNAQDRWGRTPLDDASDAGQIECVKFLEDNGCKRGAEIDNIGVTMIEGGALGGAEISVENEQPVRDLQVPLENAYHMNRVYSDISATSTGSQE